MTVNLPIPLHTGDTIPLSYSYKLPLSMLVHYTTYVDMTDLLCISNYYSCIINALQSEKQMVLSVDRFDCTCWYSFTRIIYHQPPVAWNVL